MSGVLVSFSVRNFASFRDRATLDMRFPGGVGVGARAWNGNVQPVAAVYGANASGKTTLVNAMWAMVSQVRSSYGSSTVHAEPFAFDPDCAGKPTEYSVTFVADDGVCYVYGFAVRSGVVVEEWAHLHATARATLLFEREGQSFKFGAALKGPNRSVERTTGPSSLFLSAAKAAGHERLAPLHEWITARLRVFSAHGHGLFFPHVVDALADDPGRRERVVALVAGADLGLDGLQIESRPPTPAEERQWRQIHDAMRSVPGAELPETPPSRVNRAFGAHVSGGRSYLLDFARESDGTRAMVCHAFLADEALPSGATVVFDEIDASLHPLLVRELVRVFQDRESNPNQAQAVFTTHDVSLLEPGYAGGPQLSREEVWLTVKDERGASALRPLAGFSPRTRDNLARRYLSGRYGGVPDSADLLGALGRG